MLFSFLAIYYEEANEYKNATESYKKQIEYSALALKNSDEGKMAEMRFESEIRKIQDENSKVRLMFEELSRLQDKNKSIERFMSHDFLGPSRTIADLCKVLMLSDTQNLTPKGKETLRLIIDAGDMLAEMTGSVWEFMHINEKEGSTFKVFNTEQAIRASFKKFETELRQNNIMYDIKPPFANILGNSDLLTEAINSLISNSIKYCKQPGAVIRIFCEVDRGNAVITYYDNSKGMNWDVLQRVYNLIGNSDRTGMGNGLALLKNVVELHGGSVKLASGNKEGVSFRLIFPVRTKIILFRRMAQEPENIWSIWKEVHALEEQEKEEVRRFQIEKWGRTFE
ncbi:MAG: HAMP domain-containing histidine kinase [Bacteroidetes bacterium]|nr:HAMP domain-containing histidine kinase [Bacteroidota bacterium]